MTAGPLRVVLTVGTDHHPFDRIVDWVDSWVADQDGGAVLVAQVGSSRPSRVGESHDLLPPGALHRAMAEADAVVCHGGPGTIAEARLCGCEPIVVPRSPGLGEHVDGHQERFARFMADRGRLTVATDEVTLRGLLDAVRAERGCYRLAAGSGGTQDVAMRFAELVEGLLG